MNANPLALFENRARRRALAAGERKPTKMAPAFWKHRERGGRHRPSLQPLNRKLWHREVTYATDTRGGKDVLVFAWAVEHAPLAMGRRGSGLGAGAGS